MVYTVGTERELSSVENKLPHAVFLELFRSTILLDYAYNPNRNYMESGGYSLIAETEEDVAEIKKRINFETHPCEWVDLVEDYSISLYLLNDDFSIVLFIPLEITPEILKQELEEQK